MPVSGGWFARRWFSTPVFAFHPRLNFLMLLMVMGPLCWSFLCRLKKKRTKTSNTQAFPAKRLMKGIKNIIQNNTICNNFLNRSFHPKNILGIKLTPKFIMKRIRPVKICLSCALTSLNPCRVLLAWILVNIY